MVDNSRNEYESQMTVAVQAPSEGSFSDIVMFLPPKSPRPYPHPPLLRLLPLPLPPPPPPPPPFPPPPCVAVVWTARMRLNSCSSLAGTLVVGYCLSASSSSKR